MKKMLLATTMLVAGASIAAAEVTLSGDARMGVVRPFDNSLTLIDENAQTVFSSRARVTFTMSSESDSGLSFGASFRADNAGGAASGTAGSVFISGAFGKLSMGDVDGASQMANGQIAGVGYTGVGDFNEINYLAAGGTDLISDLPAVLHGATDPTMLYEYSAGAFTAYASLSNPAQSVNALGTLSFADLDAYAIGAKYATDAYTVALGYERISGFISPAGVAPVPPAPADNTNARQITASASGTFSGVTAKVLYSTRTGTINGVSVDDNATGLSAAYTMDAISITAFGLRGKDKIAGTSATNLGLGASYDLGGGASLAAGIVRSKSGGASETAYDLGVSFKF
jgi:outer membrane protein OmpU